MFLIGLKFVALTSSKLVVAAAGVALVYGATGGGEAFTFYNVLLLAVFVGVGVAYSVAQIRDYKPNKRLREDNAGLRRDCDELQARLDLSTSENEHLKRSRDFEAALGGTLAAIAQSRAASADEHKGILDAIHGLASAIAGGNGQ